jgi:hypothetical protein
LSSGITFPLCNETGLGMAASLVGRPLAYDEHTFIGTRVDYARVCVELDALLPMVHVFHLRCRLSTKLIIVTIDYE